MKILLKRGTGSGILPETLSIGPEKPRLNEKLILNTYNYIDSVLDNENNYSALNDFLNKKIPNVKGVKSGEKLLKTNDF